jgi:GNAT superfamily N-acetyltransferase
MESKMIRTATMDDFEWMTHLSNQLGYVAHSEKTKERLAEIFASADNCVFVATTNEIGVGWIHGFYTLRVESDPFVEIGGLVIDKTYRRKGVGRLLTEQVAEWAKAKNVSAVRVRCNVVRNEAHQFYKQIGFQELKEQKIFSQTLK